jgi:hypothetical protein
LVLNAKNLVRRVREHLLLGHRLVGGKGDEA